jgi:drug/metabolite transporter (DMT)-like permease
MPLPSTTSHSPLRAVSPRVLGLLAAVVTVVIWTAFIVIARASADPQRGAVLMPLDIVCARILGASAVLLPWAWWLTRRDRRLQLAGSPPTGGGLHGRSLWGFSPLPLGVTAQIGLMGGVLYAVLAYNGFVFAPAAHASVLMPGSLPLWTALLAVVMLGDRITPLRAVGLALIVGGDLLVGGASLLHAFDGSGVWRGDVLFIASSIVWSIYSVLVRRHGLGSVRATMATTALAFVAFVPAYVLLVGMQWVPGHLLQAPWREVLFQMLFQGVGSVVISGITFTQMIHYFGPVRSTMITAVVPGLSAVAAALVLGEALPWNMVTGLALVTVGIVFGVRQLAGNADAPKNIAARADSAGAGA